MVRACAQARPPTSCSERSSTPASSRWCSPCLLPCRAEPAGAARGAPAQPDRGHAALRALHLPEAVPELQDSAHSVSGPAAPTCPHHASAGAPPCKRAMHTHARRLEFKVGDQPLSDFRMIELHYFKVRTRGRTARAQLLLFKRARAPDAPGPAAGLQQCLQHIALCGGPLPAGPADQDVRLFVRLLHPQQHQHMGGHLRPASEQPSKDQ